MQVQFFKPLHPVLDKYMEGYYFLSKDEGETDITYLTFPNNYGIISVLQHVDIDYDEYSVVIRGGGNKGFESSLITHYKKPIQIIYKGRIREITFYFKPLGLNAFLKNDLVHYIGDSFAAFSPYDDYRQAMTTALEQEDILQQRTMIEDYWLSKLGELKYPVLQYIINDLVEQAEEWTLEDIAAKYGMSRQTINKLFGIHLCKTPSDFKKIHRFRATLSKSIDTKNKKGNLTSLGYDASFYDQSHLIKDFKSLTGLTPKVFFKNISLQEEATVNWLFL